MQKFINYLEEESMGVMRFANKEYKLLYGREEAFQNMENYLKDQMPQVYTSLEDAKDALQREPARCGEKLRKGTAVGAFGMPHVWKLDLSKGWRLFYTIRPQQKEVEILTPPVDHKQYEKLLRH